MPENKQPVQLFWTGGLDSTFRLAQLVLIYGKTVQPYYIIDSGRNSTLQELRAMAAIKELLFKKVPRTRELILPTLFKEIGEIAPNPEITAAYQRLVKVETIGIQYEWLARFCEDEGINDMEISLETAVYDKDNRTRKLLGDDLNRFEKDSGMCYRLKDSAKGKDKYLIYGNLLFPAYDFTKAGKFEYSRENGFEDVLKLTWFCHMPARNSKPCGKCHPCRAVYREGLKWRLSPTAKLRYHTWPVLRKIAGLAGIK